MKDNSNGQQYTGIIGWCIAASWLAYWQLRQSWRMLLFMGIITLSAIIIVCSIPLFSTIALETSLQDAFASQPHPFSNIIRIGGDTTAPSMDQLTNSGNDVAIALRQTVGSLFNDNPAPTISSWNYILYPSNPALHSIDPMTMHMISAPDALLSAHLAITNGTLPAQRTDGSLEFVISAATANAWHVGVGSTVFVEIPPARQLSHGNPPSIPAHIVGIGAPGPDDAIFGHAAAGTSLLTSGIPNYEVYGNFAAIFAFTKQEIAQTDNTDGLFSYYWTYTIDTNHLRLDHIDMLATQGNTFANVIPNMAPDWHNLMASYIDENGFFAAVDALQSHITLFQTPTTILIIETLAFSMFFIGVIGEYVVAWQADAIATLRSRGIERGQILSAFSIQLLLLGIVSLVPGPIAAALLVQYIAHTFFFQGSANLSLYDIGVQAWNASGYALIAAGTIVVAMIFAVARASDLNILTARQESARETRRPFWQRLYLDFALGVLGIAGFIAYRQVGQNLGTYVIHTNQYLMMFSIVAPLILVTALTLLFFRLFPFLLRIGAFLASINRGAPPIIALARLSRTPRQATQTTLLLALAMCVASFTIVTMATQQQRAHDIATYTVGADFRGTLPNTPSSSLSDVTKRYQAIPGVTSVSAGASLNAIDTTNDTGITMSLQAMDGDTFGNTAYWGNTYSKTSLTTLMQQISMQREQAASTDVVPAIVDAATWNVLGLTDGAVFTLTLPGYSISAMKFIAVAQVEHLPTIFDTAGLYNQNDTVDGGILVDYQTFQAVYTHDVPGNTPGLNTVWLRTRTDQQTLSHIRTQLSAGSLKLEQLYDRDALITRYQHDPLQNDLLFAQSIIAIAAFILAFVGLLSAAGFNAAQQRIAFVILRALGTSNQQLRMIAVWEQMVIYGTGLLLGAFFSGILIWLVAPMLAFIQLFNDAGGNSVLAFDVPPVQTVIPVSMLAMAVGIVFALCLGVIFFINGQTLRNPMNQMLRLNQD